MDTAEPTETKLAPGITAKFKLVSAALTCSGLALIAVCAFAASEVPLLIEERPETAEQAISLILLVSMPHAILESLRWLVIVGIALVVAASIRQKRSQEWGTLVVIAAIVWLFAALSSASLIAFPRLKSDDTRVEQFEREVYRPVIKALENAPAEKKNAHAKNDPETATAKP